MEGEKREGNIADCTPVSNHSPGGITFDAAIAELLQPLEPHTLLFRTQTASNSLFQRLFRRLFAGV